MARHRIFVLDDEKSILFALSEYFRGRGYVVDCAQTYEQGKQLLERRSYSLVILDLHLTPEAENQGLEIVDLVREKSQATRIIMLTACGSPEIENAARTRGVDVFLQKPKPLSSLASIASTLLEDQRS